MATIIGSLRPEATPGEEKVLGLLSGLPNEYLVWPELPVYTQHPDFVLLHPELGVAVLEVKDWVEVVEANPNTFTVRTREGQQHAESNPVEQARSKAITIAHKLERRPRLLHSSGPHQGKLRVPWSYAAILPNLTRMFIYALGDIVDPRTVLCQDDLAPQRFEERLRGLDWRFSAQLSEDDIRDIRATLYPELKVTRPTDGAELGVVDLRQEQIAKEGLHQRQQSVAPDLAAASAPEGGEELTPEGQRVATEVNVRLVRGVAGSGKTLVLAMRARYLAQLHPDWQILVVTFNRALADDLARRLGQIAPNLTVSTFHALCTRWLSRAGIWQNGPVEDSQGRIAYLLNREPALRDTWDADFLNEEFAWIKDVGIRDEAHYLEVMRSGRGRRLTKKERTEVYALFRRYEQGLLTYRRFDWGDVPLLVLRALDDGVIRPAGYDVILVDEAQDFAPTWFTVLRRHLNPEGHSMFMAADSTQRIYCRFSWRSMGLNVVGRTRILPRSYRSTYEIMRAATALVQGNPDLAAELRDEEEDLLEPDLNPGWMRHGPTPQLLQFRDRAGEEQYLARAIKRLVGEGLRPSDIAVLHRKKFGPDRYRSGLRKAGVEGVKLPSDVGGDGNAVQFHTIHSVKGLEYRAVFILQAQLLFEPDTPVPYEELPKFLADELRLLYVAMTRAREQLCITYQGTLPEPVQVLPNYLRTEATASE